MRTARALGISTVAVHSDADADALFVRQADRAVRLPGVSSADTYLVGERIIAAAQASGADAIHPGYGFLSENPGFARAVVAAGLTWIGPTPESIEAMALKVEAKRIAESAGVPLVPGAELPQGISDADASAVCETVGYPLLVKASAGGGGKGMRIVDDGRRPRARRSRGARREALSAFGDDTVFVERYLAGCPARRGAGVRRPARLGRPPLRARVLDPAPPPEGDRGGAVARRDAVVRAALHAAATSLARSIGYVGAGTVEFMVFGAGDAQEFFFLEMNTRLQVEHPGDRGDHRPRPGRLADRGGAGRAAAPAAGADRRARARDRGAAVRRGPGARLPARDRASCTASPCPTCRRLRVDTGRR